MAYTIKRKNNQIIVNSTTQITLVIYNEIDLENALVIETNTFTENYIFEMQESQVYRVNIEGTDYKLFHFTYEINNLVKDIKRFLCDKCNDYINDCLGCDKEKEKYLFLTKYNNLTSKLLYLKKELDKWYSNVETNNANNFIYQALESISCKVKPKYDLLITEECIEGFSNKIELYRSLLTVNFLALYFLEYNNILNYIELDEDNNEINYIDSLFQIEDIKNCLCNTCLRFNELTTIFDEGVNETPTPTNPNLPLSNNINIFIESSNSEYSYQLQINNFSIYSLIEPISQDYEKIKFVTIPSNLSFIDNNQVNVTINQEVNKFNIPNYFLKVNENNATYNYDTFNFQLFDGTNWTPIYSVTAHLIANSLNNPVIVNDGFIEYFNSSNRVLLTKQDILEKGDIIDLESDLIKYFKVIEKTNNITVELKNVNDNNYTTLSLNSEIDFEDYNDLDVVLRITKTVSLESFYNIKISFKDVGSNIYSDSIITLNYMNVEFKEQDILQAIFTGGFFIDEYTNAIVVPIGRIFANNPIQITSVIETGGFTGEIDNLVSIGNSNNNFYDIYDSHPNLPTLNSNHRDLFLFHNFLNSNKSFTVNISAGNLNLSIPVTIGLTTNQSSITRFLRIDTAITDATQFDYLLDENNWETDFINNGSIIDSSEPISVSNVLAGYNYTFISNGFIAFLAAGTVNNYVIKDSLNNDVTNSFTVYNNSIQNLTLFVSNNIYTPQSIYFKFIF